MTAPSPSPAGTPPAGPPAPTPTLHLSAQIAGLHAPDRQVSRLAHPDAVIRPLVTDALSGARFGTYLRYANGSEARAWAAYAWNVRVCSELLQVLLHAEVALRNAVDRALSAAFSPTWPNDTAFLFTFSAKGQRDYLADLATLERRLRKAPLNTGDFIAGQTFVFWESILVSRYKDRVWKAQFARVFPGVSAETYKDVHDAAEQLRKLRNRIAHHEPLLTIDVCAMYRVALQVIHWASPEKAAWVALEWPMTDALAGPP